MACVLVADSDSVVRSSIGRALRLRGHRVRTAPSLQEARAELDAASRLDAIVIGLEIPDPRGVRAVWGPLRDAADGVPVVVCSASAKPKRTLGEVAAWFRKPLEVRQLLDFVDELDADGRR